MKLDAMQRRRGLPTVKDRAPAGLVNEELAHSDHCAARLVVVLAVVLAMNILPLLQIRCDVRVIRKLSLLSRWRRLRPSGINRQAVASGSFIIAVYIPRIQH